MYTIFSFVVSRAYSSEWCLLCEPIVYQCQNLPCTPSVSRPCHHHFDQRPHLAIVLLTWSQRRGLVPIVDVFFSL